MGALTLLKEEDAVYRIDELDDELLKMAERHPRDVERICVPCWLGDRCEIPYHQRIVFGRGRK